MVSLWKISFTAAIVVLAPLSAQAGPHSLARSSDAWGSGGVPSAIV